MNLARWDRHKRFVGFSQEDEALLVRHDPIARTYVQGLVDELYAHLLNFKEARALLANQSVLGSLKRLQQTYFLDLTGGDYGEAYLSKRLRVARKHLEVGLPLHLYLNTYSVYLQLLIPRVLGAGARLELAQATLASLVKLILLDQEVVVECYLESQTCLEASRQ